MCLALPGRVEEIRDQESAVPMARVDFGGVRRDVCLAYTPEATVGAWVLVHVGFAISVVDEAAAESTHALLQSRSDDVPEGPE